MSPLVSTYAMTLLLVGYIAACVVWIVAAALLPILRKAVAAARRRLVIGARVRQPEWRARRLQNGQWVVDRVRR